MKKYLSILLILMSNIAFSQSSVGIKLGGSNFIGASLNYNYTLYTNYVKEQYIDLSAGLGYTPWGPSYIFNSSLSFHQKNLGIGVEHTRFYNDFFFKSIGGNNFVDMLIYPNLNYCVLNRRVKVSLSAGAYFAFRKYTNSPNDNKMDFEGDVIPGGGIGISYKL